jgi:hypothetical protein
MGSELRDLSTRVIYFSLLIHLNPAVSNPCATCAHRNTIAIVETMTWPLFVHAVEQRLH